MFADGSVLNDGNIASGEMEFLKDFIVLMEKGIGLPTS
jgi:hypothetical protein